jgi:transposase-like protein
MTANYDKNGLAGRKRRGAGYDKRFIKKIVEAIEKGLPRSEAIKAHGMSRSALSDWMREYGSQAYHARKQGHLSLAQRRSVVRAIEEGRMTVAEAKLAHNLGWTPTIKKWLRHFQRENEELVATNKTLMAKKAENQQQQPDPDPGKEALEEALKKLQESELKVKALNTLIDIAEEQFKISIRKKPGAKQS